MQHLGRNLQQPWAPRVLVPYKHLLRGMNGADSDATPLVCLGDLQTDNLRRGLNVMPYGMRSEEFIHGDLRGMACGLHSAVGGHSGFSRFDVGNTVSVINFGYTIRGAGQGNAEVGDLQTLTDGLDSGIFLFRRNQAAIHAMQGDADTLCFALAILAPVNILVRLIDGVSYGPGGFVRRYWIAFQARLVIQRRAGMNGCPELRRPTAGKTHLFDVLSFPSGRAVEEFRERGCSYRDHILPSKGLECA